MNIVAQIIAWLNGLMNGVFGVLRGPMSALPPWLSLTVISALLGVILLVLFKYTSPQKAIGRTRDRIKARLLAMKLFKDSIPVVLKSQVQVFLSAIMLLLYSIPPMLVMILPFMLILGQLGTWYQAKPLEIGAEAVVIMQLADHADLDSVSLSPAPAFRLITGPVRVPSKQQVYWKIWVREEGAHQIQFKAGNAKVTKQLAVGPGFMPTSIKRPAMHACDLILYPSEKPFNAESPVQSIEIRYPGREAPVTGSGHWVISLFILSMLGAFAVKPFLKVKI